MPSINNSGKQRMAESVPNLNIVNISSASSLSDQKKGMKIVTEKDSISSSNSITPTGFLNFVRLRQKLQLAANKALASPKLSGISHLSSPLLIEAIKTSNSQSPSEQIKAAPEDEKATGSETSILATKRAPVEAWGSSQNCPENQASRDKISVIAEEHENFAAPVMKKSPTSLGFESIDLAPKPKETEINGNFFGPSFQHYEKENSLNVLASSDNNAANSVAASGISSSIAAGFVTRDACVKTATFPRSSLQKAVELVAKPISPEKPILVLDLDETLIHSSMMPRRTSDFWIEVIQNNDSRTREVFWVYKRPGVDAFLAEIKEYYTIYVFTAGIRDYASQILDRLDPAGTIFKGRLYRDECSEIKGQGTYAKDLTKITNNMERVLLVDNTPACFSLQPANGLPIKSWYTDVCDRQLFRLREFLIHAANVKDIRLILSEWSMQ